jgi:hypothetical protein
MAKGWDWVVGTGLYVAALLLSWLTLISIERFGATEVRSWAPLIQAVLSALAIFSAWFLQGQKRNSDRADAIQDTRTLIKVLTRLAETDACFLVQRGHKGELDRTTLEFNGGGLDAHAGLLRSQKAGHLTEGAIHSLAAFTQITFQIAVGARWVAGQLKDDDKAPVAPFQAMYDRLYSQRTALLMAIGQDPEVDRVPPSSFPVVSPK